MTEHLKKWFEEMKAAFDKVVSDMEGKKSDTDSAQNAQHLEAAKADLNNVISNAQSKISTLTISDPNLGQSQADASQSPSSQSSASSLSSSSDDSSSESEVNTPKSSI